MKNLLLIFFLSLITSSLYGQNIYDESYSDLSFWAFKAELENCILKKDLNKLKNLLNDTIYESKDNCGSPGCSKGYFIKDYFSKEQSEETWNTMLKIVRFGFFKTKDKNLLREDKSENELFRAPSYLKNIDSNTEIIVLGENVNIRERPSLKSKVLKTVSFEKFKCDCNVIDMKKTTFQTINGIDWLEIKLENNKIGYISTKLTSYFLDKEMTVEKINGKWKIISFFNAPGC